MEYRQAFWYILDRRGGFGSLMLLTVCQFIPVVGPIVMLGYKGEVAVALDRDPGLRRHPKFSFDYFVEYLTRGVWPFLLQLIIAACMTPLFFVAFFAVFLINPPALNNPPLFFFAIFGIAFVIMMAISALTIPMTFHAEFTGKLDFGGAFRFSAAFWKLVGGQAIITGLVYMLMAWVVTILGLLVCCIGVYPASVLTQMAATHLMVQLYREYLDRGGEPLVEYDPDGSYGRREDERWLRFDEREEDEPLE